MYTEKDIVVLLQNKMAKKTKIDGQLCRLYGIVWVSIWSNYLSIFRLQTAGKEKHKSHTFSYWAYFPFLFCTAQKSGYVMVWYEQFFSINLNCVLISLYLAPFLSFISFVFLNPYVHISLCRFFFPENKRTKHWAFILIFHSTWGEAIFTSCALCSWQIDQISILSTYTQLCIFKLIIIFIIIINVDDFDTPWCLFAVHCFNEVLLMRFVTKKNWRSRWCLHIILVLYEIDWILKFGGFLICLMWFVC